LTLRPLDADEGAVGNALLRIELNKKSMRLRNMSGLKTASRTENGSFLPV